MTTKSLMQNAFQAPQCTFYFQDSKLVRSHHHFLKTTATTSLSEIRQIHLMEKSKERTHQLFPCIELKLTNLKNLELLEKKKRCFPRDDCKIFKNRKIMSKVQYLAITLITHLNVFCFMQVSLVSRK